MFREMRRGRQALSQKECSVILGHGTSGVLALCGDNNYPYALPISYVYDTNKLYFHSAQSGHKLDAICRNPKASFCVIEKDEVVPEKYTSYFRSVIVFGSIRILTDEKEKRMAIEKLALKYAPHDSADHREKVIRKEWEPLCMLEMTVEHMSGKEAVELMQAKQQMDCQ